MSWSLSTIAQVALEYYDTSELVFKYSTSQLVFEYYDTSELVFEYSDTSLLCSFFCAVDETSIQVSWQFALACFLFPSSQHLQFQFMMLWRRFATRSSTSPLPPPTKIKLRHLPRIPCPLYRSVNLFLSLLQARITLSAKLNIQRCGKRYV